MRDVSLRHSIATDEDIENISDKWTFQEKTVVLKNIKGYHEARLVHVLPAKLQDLLHNFSALRISFRDERRLGDLFFVDSFPGVTLELEKKDASNALDSDFEVYKYLELLTGINLGISEGSNAFIDIGNRKVFYSGNASSDSFFSHIRSSFVDISDYIEDSRYLEFALDSDAALLTLRTVSAVSNSLVLRTSSSADINTEVGLLQRQKRHLEDSEFKGLSTYLPSKDFDPFMIFFDQRLRPLTKSGKITTRIGGQGSHLKFDTRMTDDTRFEISSQKQKACKLLSMYYLPKTHFFDLFELEGLLGRDNVELYGEQDLEAPVWAVKGWGSILVAKLDSSEGQSHLQLPFHARYSEPNKGGQARPTQITAPQVFTACYQDDAAYIDNPWEPHTLKELLIGENFRLRFFDNEGPSSYLVTTAVADDQAAGKIMWITLLSLLIGTVFILSKVLQGLSDRQRYRGSSSAQQSVTDSASRSRRTSSSD